MRKLLNIVLTTSALLASATAFSKDCFSLSSEAAMGQCASEKYLAEDKKLNKIYGDYRKKLSEDQKKLLTQVQQTWIKYRDQACAFEASGSEGGSIYPLAITLCKTDKTSLRVKELEVLANCKEGDSNCPAW